MLAVFLCSKFDYQMTISAKFNRKKCHNGTWSLDTLVVLTRNIRAMQRYSFAPVPQNRVTKKCAHIAPDGMSTLDKSNGDDELVMMCRMTINITGSISGSSAARENYRCFAQFRTRLPRFAFIPSTRLRRAAQLSIRFIAVTLLLKPCRAAIST